MKAFLSIVLGLIVLAATAQKIKVTDLQCEHKTNPLGIGEMKPRFSWKLDGEARNILQSAYQIRVSTSPDLKNSIWDSGKVPSDQSVLQEYKGSDLKSRTRYYWQVKVWDNTKKESSWSTTANFETGMLDNAEWKAKWIEPVQDTARKIPAHLVRKEFNVKKAVSRARAYVTGHGFYELSLNGRKVGDQLLTPGWTAYEDRLQYQVYDITSMLRQGNNAVGAMLGDGWYRGTLGWINRWGIWGKKLGLLCQINVVYTDGTEDVIITDSSWKGSADGPIVMNGIYEGETYDARKEMSGWNSPGFNDRAWKAVNEADHSLKNLVAMQTVPVREIQQLKPKKIFKTPKGTLVADFGQNMVGWVRLKVRGNAGTTVTIRHAEVLDKFGEFYTENLRHSTATATYTLKGSGDETYEPRFSFFGFRYIAVDGFPGELTNDAVTGIVIHSDMKPTGTFECSDTLLNQLQHNIVWGQKGNFLDVPTDCPQRDERLGWTGDAQAFARTAAYNMNVAPFFTKWLKDVAADQAENGSVPFVVPNALGPQAAGSAGWADVATIIPWNMYEVYGDRRILENQYESMKAWVGYMESQSTNDLWNKGFHFGDWLFFIPPDDRDGRAAVSDKYMIAQCFFAHSTQLVINAAKVLGKTDEAAKYETLLRRIKEAYRKEYMTPAGRLISGTQTAYVLALHFDMLPEELRQQAAQRLVENIKSYDNHLTTGFLGTPYLCHVLTRFGHNDVAYDLLLQKTYPSWLYPVTMGATTIWERWDGQKPDSTFQNAGMNSFNHYAYGAIGDWMYRVVGGIEIGAPGYKHIIIQPQPDARLSHAKTTYESGYGLIRSGWERKDNQMVVSVRIPPNTTATVNLPNAELSTVQENKSGITNKPQFKNARQEGSKVIFDLGSGEYTFSYSLKSNDLN